MISWADVHEIQVPCWRTFQNLRFEVEQKPIDAWKDDPDEVWAVVRTGLSRSLPCRFLDRRRGWSS
jgi:hypothetical protein